MTIFFLPVYSAQKLRGCAGTCSSSSSVSARNESFGIISNVKNNNNNNNKRHFHDLNNYLLLTSRIFLANLRVWDLKGDLKVLFITMCCNFMCQSLSIGHMWSDHNLTWTMRHFLSLSDACSTQACGWFVDKLFLMLLDCGLLCEALWFSTGLQRMRPYAHSWAPRLRASLRSADSWVKVANIHLEMESATTNPHD